MPLNDGQIADFKQHLREMPEEKLRLELETRSINQEWKRSLARMDLERREYEKWADRFNAQESAREDAQRFQATQISGRRSHQAAPARRLGSPMRDSVGQLRSAGHAA